MKGIGRPALKRGRPLKGIDLNLNQIKDKQIKRARERGHVTEITVDMPTSIENYGSTTRDYCMLERNFLAHAKLALLLMLVSSSVLLQARLESPANPEKHGSNKFGIPLAAIEVVSAFIVIGSGLWQYESGTRDMRARRAFLLSSE